MNIIKAIYNIDKNDYDDNLKLMKYLLIILLVDIITIIMGFLLIKMYFPL